MLRDLDERVASVVLLEPGLTVGHNATAEAFVASPDSTPAGNAEEGGRRLSRLSCGVPCQ